MDVPRTKNAPFIRIDFSDGQTWNELVLAIGKESEDGFLANIDIVSDPLFDGANADELAASAARMNIHAILLIADADTLQSAEHPILCLDLHNLGCRFRVVPAELWGVENNLSIANMDFDEFASSTDPDGIFRGFS